MTVRMGELPPSGGVSPVFDGYTRTPEQEAQINEALALCFGGAVGETAMAYLKSITVNRVESAGVEAEVLFHREGSRWLVGVIDARVRAHMGK